MGHGGTVFLTTDKSFQCPKLNDLLYLMLKMKESVLELAYRVNPKACVGKTKCVCALVSADFQANEKLYS